MLRYFVALSIAALTMLAPAMAAEFGTKEEAVAMVKHAQEQFKKDGPEATFKAVSDKSVTAYHDRDLYPFIYDMRVPNRGVNVAHGARPALIGKNLIDLKDQDGKYLIREMIEIAEGKGSGWVTYKWPNPITNKIEDKSEIHPKNGRLFRRCRDL